MAVLEPTSQITTSNGALKADKIVNGRSGENNSNNKKSRETDRRRRRRKQKKNKSTSSQSINESEDNVKEHNDSNNEISESVEIEYVPEKPEIEDVFLEEFKNVFEKFTFKDSAPDTEDNDTKDESAADAAAKKKSESDSDEEEQDTQQKEKGISNKKKKLQRRMKIAELKQISSRPDVVEVWDATASDPKLLVFLKSYRNTVPVPRHWSQKRKFLQAASFKTME